MRHNYTLIVLLVHPATIDSNVRFLLGLVMRQSELVIQARSMSKHGATVSEISKLLKTDSTKISRWVNSIERMQQRTKAKNGIIRIQSRERIYSYNRDKVQMAPLTQKEAKLYASVFYWCEGAKYPSSNNVNFTTSDVKMQMLFLTLFRKAFRPNESKFRIWLQLHTTHDRDKVFQYWSEKLKIPITQFYKPHITSKRGGRYREEYMGTCSLRYADYRLLLRMMGIYTRLFESLVI